MIVFFGHHRCGTTSTSAILDDVCRELGLRHEVRNWLNSAEEARAAAADLDALSYTNAVPHVAAGLHGCRGVHLVRDPRDQCVSQYFSDLLSHAEHGDWPALRERRAALQALSKDDGLMYEIESLGHLYGAMASWDYDQEDILELRLEDISVRPFEVYLEMFDFLGLVDADAVRIRDRLQGDLRSLASRVMPRPLSHLLAHRRPAKLTVERVCGIVHAHGFYRRSGGRQLGEEDVTAHFRKGVPGDWRNHFTSSHVDRFKELYGEVLITLGYERDDNWGAPVPALD